MEKKVPKSLDDIIKRVRETFPEDHELHTLFEKTFLNTYMTTIQNKSDGKTFVITGDIPAMWLRDSTAQVRPYLLASHDPDIETMLLGVLRQQIEFILLDPYANAFNKEPNNQGFQSDKTDMHPHVWERKYEIDSLCYPVQLGYLIWKETGKVSHFDQDFKRAVHSIIHLWKVEQKHEEHSPYSFERMNVRQSDTLNRSGKGSRTGFTGMTWSGFRPSDDACLYGYLVPSNMFAIVTLEYMKEINDAVWNDPVLQQICSQLRLDMMDGLNRFAITDHPHHGRIYCYEVDGLGNKLLMDDANVPSLLSAPYLGFCAEDDPIYLNTRAFLLSRENPFYYEGSVAKGIGSPHTPDHYIWHIALSIQGLTAVTKEEKMAVLEMIKSTDAETGYLHEGFNASNPNEYTRDWFAWSNSLFSEFVLDLCGLKLKGSPLSRSLQ
ncbi:glycoside hydrolase family 125 protein [Halalkalibacter sp. APA_J-10(15)]|uniref:glycoside hydrolase family 125 protein n=1 Tax=Halalkalibacter sp. APA_J-10(15) TaxID=2933805 RepID=UPI001FF34233|nr:glycoside hydrolase family 125 protein [Halalkalibacter sp. APA_J-10(15)]MCK0470148.1 glycoside hydrolase family 125 protein [Halalkalibacter sp. APA_J-10(15)]